MSTSSTATRSRQTWSSDRTGIAASSGSSRLSEPTIVYGLPSASLDAQRFASGCEDAKDKQEAVIEGTIGYVEELLGIRYIVLNVNTVKFVEPLE